MVPSAYPVTWVSNGSGPWSGKAELGARVLRLDSGTEAAEDIRYDDVTAAYVGSRSQRLGGRPTLVIERGNDPPVRIAGVAQVGIVNELAERLAGLRFGHARARRRIVVVVPLKDDVAEEVEALLDRGPPFDPAAVGLRNHEVFVTEHEAVFIFDLADDAAIDRLLGTDGVWEAAASWSRYAAGPARIGDEAFAWSRSA